MNDLPSGSQPPRMRALDHAAAIAGTVFIGVSGYITIGALIWALWSMTAAPSLVLNALLVIALPALLIVCVGLYRHAIRLQRRRDLGDPLA